MEQNLIQIENLTLEHYHTLKESMIEAYASIGGNYWKEESIAKLISKFPQGQIVLI